MAGVAARRAVTSPRLAVVASAVVAPTHAMGWPKSQVQTWRPQAPPTTRRAVGHVGTAASHSSTPPRWRATTRGARRSQARIMMSQTTVSAATAAVAVVATTLAKAVYSSFFMVETVAVRATVKARVPIARGASYQRQVLPDRRVGKGRQGGETVRQLVREV